MVEIDISPAAMIGRKMEHDLLVPDRLARNTRFAEICFGKCDAARLDVIFDVAQASAAKVVDDVDLSAALEERVNQVGADKGSSTGNEDFLTTPDDFLRSWLGFGVFLPGPREKNVALLL